MRSPKPHTSKMSPPDVAARRNLRQAAKCPVCKALSRSIQLNLLCVSWCYDGIDQGVCTGVSAGACGRQAGRQDIC